MSIPALFTPSAVSAEELDALTVGRTDLLATLTARITSAARDGSRPHTLLVGPRGSGKTHTLQVALGRALADPATAARVLPVVVAEDSLAIGSYTDLLVEMARAVGPVLADEARTLRLARDPVGIEAALIDAAAGRTILLAIENLDRVFDALGTAGQGSLRAWVETSTAVLIVATTPALFPGVSSREYPWYGSFMVETLPDLGVEDTATLLRRAAERRGDTELVAFLDTPAVDALLDRLSPYFQHRLWLLPAGEQRLIVELARGQGSRTVSDLARAVGVSNQSASAALGRLAADHWVTSSKTADDRRTSWYDLTEPLLRSYLRYRTG